MWIWQVYTASLYGKSIRQLYMAGLFGGSNGLIHQKIESKKTLQSKGNRKEWNLLWWICKMQYHCVVSNIVLFALLQVHRNQQIVVLVPWLCGSVNLTANENTHHEEE